MSSRVKTPLKIAGFKVRDAGLEGKGKYCDWRFNYKPAPAAGAAAKPAAGAQPAAASKHKN